MSIFSDQDTQQTRERSTRNIAITKPTGFGENMEATWDEFRNNDRYGSLREQRREAFNSRIKLVQKLTGEKLDTPLNRFGEDSFLSNLIGLRSARDSVDPENRGPGESDIALAFRDYQTPFAAIGMMFDGVDNDLTEPQRIREHEARLDAIRESLPPEQRNLIPTRDEIEGQLRERAQGLEAKAQDIGSRATTAGVVGGFAGASAAALVQPEVLVTLPLGAPVRAGLLSKVLIEAGIGAASEAVLQPSVQDQRDQLGLESGFDQAVQNVAMAGLGAGALTGIMGLIAKGGVAAFEKAVKRPATANEKALVQQYQRDAEVEAQVPFEQQDLAAKRVHLENEQAGFDAALQGRALGENEIKADPRLDPKPVEQVDGSSVVVLRGDELAGIGVDANLMQFKAGGDAEGVTDRLRGVTKWEVERAGVSLVYEFEDGKRIIADGHQRLGLARRLSAEGQDVELPTLILREADGVTPEEARARAAFKNIAEGTGTAQDAAKVLRDMGATPEDMGLPPKSALVRDAEGLTRLDDETFGLVINDILSEQFGAIVGRLVDDPRMQPEIARLLVKLKPANATEADSIVRQAMDAGASRETQSSLFGDEEVVQSLYLEKARVLDRAMRMIRRNVDTFRTLNERGGDIAQAGNILNEASNAQRLELEKMLKEYLQRQAHRKGVVGDALTKAAREAQETGQYAGPSREFVKAVTRAVESGEINGDALSGRGIDPQPQRAGAAGEDQLDGGFEQVDDDTLEMFSEPVGKASDDQALAIQRELVDEDTANRESVKRAQQEDQGLRNNLGELIAKGAPTEEIEAHPAVVQAIDKALSIPPTHEAPGFMSESWRANRQMQIGGEEVVGVDDGVARLYDLWTGLAYADDGLEVPENPVTFDRQATLILGPPAAGKSTIANPIARQNGAMIIDSDEVKKTLPEFQNGIGANAVHEESGMIANEVMAQAIGDGANLVIPKVGGSVSSIEKVTKALKGQGYNVRIVNMAVSPDEAYKRMFARFVATGRLVPPEYVRQVGDTPSKTFAELQQKGIGDAFNEIDNNSAIDAPKKITKDDGFLAKVDFGSGAARGQDGGPSSRSVEQTPEGEQTLIEGVEPITDTDRLRALADAPMRGGEAAADDGLFDLMGRGQGDLLDLDVPMGEKIDADGNRVADTSTIRDVFDQLEDDQEFFEQLKLCDGGGK